MRDRQSVTVRALVLESRGRNGLDALAKDVHFALITTLCVHISQCAQNRLEDLIAPTPAVSAQARSTP